MGMKYAERGESASEPILVTWNQSNLIDDAKDITARLEEALQRGALDDAAVLVDRLRVLTRFLSDEIFAIRAQEWDDQIGRSLDVETK